MPDPPVRLRIPVIENLATRNGDILARDSRILSSRERDLADFIFEQSVNLNSVRIVTSSVIAAPTTFGNYIRIPPGYSLPDETLMHELTHVWQYQNMGNAYISDSLFHQTVAIITTGDRNNAYTYAIVPGRPLSFYTAEQQAMIVEDYFKTLTLRVNPDYQRLIAQIRNARPSLTDRDRYLESLYGAGYQNPHSDILRDTPGINPTNTIPIFRVEF
jgi:hypothetical protein